MSRLLVTREERFWVGMVAIAAGILALIADPVVPILAGFVVVLLSLPKREKTTFIDLTSDHHVEKVTNP